MKINKLLIGILGLGVCTTSCNLESSNEDNYLTNTYLCSNLIIPESGESYATNATYSLIYYYTSGTVTASSSNLILGSGATTFTTNPMTYKADMYRGENGGLMEVTTFEGGQSIGGSTSVSKLQGYTSEIVNILSTNEEYIPEYQFKPFKALVMSYDVNSNYTVKTFMPDAIYTGTTTIASMGSASEPYISSQTKYRVMFNQDYKTADILFYNSNFAPTMPSITFVIKDLPVQYTDKGYKISGSDIVPEQWEGGAFTPNPRYSLTSFEFVNTSDNLTTGTLKFVFGPYLATFTGSYVRSGNE